LFAIENVFNATNTWANVKLDIINMLIPFVIAILASYVFFGEGVSLYVEDVTCMVLFALGVLVVHFFSVRFILQQRREDGKLVGRSDFVFRDNKFVVGVAFLWLMLSSMAFEGRLFGYYHKRCAYCPCCFHEFWIAS